MKLLSININPPEKCAANLEIEFKSISNADRKNRIIDLIRNRNPDVIFFIEQWYPVFSLIEEHLKQNGYVFCYPKKFYPSFCKDGTYLSYAGLVAAVKSNHKVSFEDGKSWTNKSAKWLSLNINNKIYLAVHYPQPGKDWDQFNNSVKSFLSYTNEKPCVVLGDFNTPKNLPKKPIKIQGYKDVLPQNRATYSTGTKLDYIFLNEKYMGKVDAELIDDSRIGDNIFSDHSVTIITL